LKDALLDGHGSDESSAMEITNPYQRLPEFTRWSKAVGLPQPDRVDPAAAGFPFRIGTSDRVATGGSCFAQHIARHLSDSGFNYFVVEPGHSMISHNLELLKKYNYGIYSARYGNIYTSRQLLQLFKRAYGTFAPTESAWRNRLGGFLDPFRPEIQPDGFTSERELLLEREQHLKAVRHMFENLDVFVFTLGLTEHWVCRDDGAVLPVCPGVNGGSFSDEKYEFQNLDVNEVLQDMEEFVNLLRGVNKNSKMVLTVSPVPLAATAENKHVLVSTTYSKSVLRVAAEMLSRHHENVGYFPSYEIVTGSFNRGQYFAKNLRDVVEDGVRHVMRLFLKHATFMQSSEMAHETASNLEDHQEFYRRMENVVQTVCEEALLDASFAAQT
jgi:hypothetical protein